MIKDFADFLEGCCRRPAMYVGQQSIRLFAIFLEGYIFGICECEQPNPLEGWQRWIEKEFSIRHAAWGWDRIILHEYGSDKRAFEELPSLYKRFDRERAEIGVEGIEQLSDLKLSEFNKAKDMTSEFHLENAFIPFERPVK